MKAKGYIDISFLQRTKVNSRFKNAL